MYRSNLGRGDFFINYQNYSIHIKSVRYVITTYLTLEQKTAGENRLLVVETIVWLYFVHIPQME